MTNSNRRKNIYEDHSCAEECHQERSNFVNVLKHKIVNDDRYLRICKSASLTGLFCLISKCNLIQLISVKLKYRKLSNLITHLAC